MSGAARRRHLEGRGPPEQRASQAANTEAAPSTSGPEQPTAKPAFGPELPPAMAAERDKANKKTVENPLLPFAKAVEARLHSDTTTPADDGIIQIIKKLGDLGDEKSMIMIQSAPDSANVAEYERGEMRERERLRLEIEFDEELWKNHWWGTAEEGSGIERDLERRRERLKKEEERTPRDVAEKALSDLKEGWRKSEPGWVAAKDGKVVGFIPDK